MCKNALQLGLLLIVMYKKCIIASEIRKLYETVEFMLSNKVENDMRMGKK